MAKRSASPSQKSTGSAQKAAAQRKPSSKSGSPSVEKRLNAVFHSITEELLTTLEHNYDRTKR